MTLLQVLKKFFIDEPITKVKLFYFWVFSSIGVRFPFLYIPFYYWFIRRPIRVDKDGFVALMQLNSSTGYGCNLRCAYCNAFSPHQSGYYPADELLATYTQWRKRLKPQYFALTGGEPFLHPELPRILRESAKIWNDSKLWIMTNGLLLERIKPDVIQTIKETGYKLIISEHTFEPEHRKILDAGYARLKQEGISFVVRPNNSTWLAVYQYGEAEKIFPYKSNPKKAWNNCMFRACALIVDGKLYKCPYLWLIANAVQQGALDAEAWKSALTYKPLTLDSPPETIVEHLRIRVMPECTVCLEKCVMVPARQLPLLKEV